MIQVENALDFISSDLDVKIGRSYGECISEVVKNKLGKEEMNKCHEMFKSKLSVFLGLKKKSKN